MGHHLGAFLTFIKYSLFAFNFIFWALGCSLVGVGTWIITDAKKILQIYNVNVPDDIKKTVGTMDIDLVQAGGVAIIVIGAIIMISGFLGCCGAIRESEAMLSMFFGILFLMFIVLIAIGIVAIVKGDFWKELLAKAMRMESGENSDDKLARAGNTLLSFGYRAYGCCGVDNMPECDRDYPPLDITPRPCALGMDSCRKGCLNVIWGVMAEVAIGAGVAALVAGSFVIIGMMSSMCLCCALRQQTF